MPVDTRYRWDSLTAEDAHAWAELTNHLAEVDGTEEFYSAEDRAEELADEHTDLQKDTVAVWEGEQLVAFGTVWVRLTVNQEGYVDIGLDGGVHAAHRQRGIGTELMKRLERRAAESVAATHPGTPYYFSTGGGLEGSSARTFHLGRGYEVVRYFNLMGRPLNADETADQILGRQSPEDVEIRAPRREDETAVFNAHSAAFVDHWGYAPPVPSVWHERWTSRSNRHESSRIAVDPAGEVLAYSLCAQWVDRELYVNLVGTVPQARGRGLGSAVLAHSIVAAAGSGDYDVIELDVDSASLTGATRLYERIGFTVKHTSALVRYTPQDQR